MWNFDQSFALLLSFLQLNVPPGGLTSMDLDPRVTVHYGVPSTASIMALDPIQSLLAIGTL